MGFLAKTTKKIIFWIYPRTSWQWDVLCVLILVFIFLTPKSWFENSAYKRSHAAQTTVLLGIDVIGAQSDRSQIEERARQAGGRADGQVTAVRELHDGAGRLIGYEVDIR